MLSRLPLARLGALALLGASGSLHAPSAPPDRVAINDNRAPAGTLRNGVLTIRLEVREGEWRPDRDNDPGLVLRAFAEVGKPPAIPGPLIRVPEGTEIHATLRNALSDSTLLLHGFSTRGLADSADVIQLKPGETREVRFSAGSAGTYYYWGSSRSGAITDRPPRDAELAGAFVIDPAGTQGPPRDRVLVLGEWNREARPGGVVLRTDLTRFTINGKTWPNTERLAYALGDTVRFRVVNPTDNPHPMHLHGFYYRVESRGDGSRDTRYDPGAPPQLVVTERVPVGRTYTMAWVPERAGYWLFHCHNNFHVLRGRPLDGSPQVPEYRLHAQNHALELMGGLVMGIEVRPTGPATAAEPVARRRLRLIAQVDSAGGGSEAEPNYRYVLEEDGRTTAAGPSLPGPLILLQRGEPVSIRVVNQLPEPTAVHWHGIELDSYMDGVAGFSGHPGRIAPVIMPRDSFEARFTPPRAGSFIYHPHADEVRQQQAGLSGALLVVDDPAAFDPGHDLVLLLSTPRRTAEGKDKILLNGSMTPAPLELRVGERYRFRLINIHTNRPSMILRLVRDSTLVTWRAIAKDGMDLPAERAVMGPAVQQSGNGETYDFEFTPREPGDFRVTVTGVGGTLVAMPVRVR
jgi:FtsP/CotA-like multicopper oxidase with cupredoxin domain